MSEIKTTSAKYLLTTLLPNEINYGHTIDEAEKVDAISEAMEEYAEQQALGLIDYIESEGFVKLKTINEYSNGEVHRTIEELYEDYWCSKK